MAQRRMIQIVLRLQKSRAYRVLKNLYEKGLFVKSFFKKIKMHFVVLKRKINKILRNMKKRGLSDGRRMYFYRLVRKFLPIFPKVFSI